MPADRVVAAYNLVALAGWLPYLADMRARAFASAHAAIAVAFLAGAAWAPWSRRWSDADVVERAAPARGWTLLRDTYPLALIVLAWNELGARHGYLHGTERNAWIVAVDAWLCAPLLGGHANLLWAPTMPGLSEAMQAAYFTFFPLLLVLALRIVLATDPAHRREGVLRIALTFFGCFALYTVLPIDGPLALFPRFTDGIAAGPFFRMNLALRSSGDSLGTAFPSSHVAGSVTLAWVAWRCCRRATAWVYTAVAAAIGLAVIYTQNHFVADAIAGAATAVALQAVVAPRLLAAASRLPGVRRARGLAEWGGGGDPDPVPSHVTRATTR